MKRGMQFGIFIAILLGLVMVAHADTINLSFNPTDWEVVNTTWEASDASFNLNGDGNLQATLSSSHPGTAWRVTRKTIDTYNFQNATLRYQWKVNGFGLYSAVTTGTRSTYYFDPNGTPAGYYTTHHSWAGSEVINSNAWIFTEIEFNETGYHYNMSYSEYGGTPFINGTGTMTATRWDSLAEDSFFFSMGDNYSSGSYFELAEAYIKTPGASPAPEPTTMLLFGMGLLGVAGVSRRKNQIN